MRPPPERLTIHFWVFLFSSSSAPNVEVRPPAVPDSSILDSFNLKSREGGARGSWDPVIMSEKALVCNYQLRCKSLDQTNPRSSTGEASLHMPRLSTTLTASSILHDPQNLLHTKTPLFGGHITQRFEERRKTRSGNILPSPHSSKLPHSQLSDC